MYVRCKNSIATNNSKKVGARLTKINAIAKSSTMIEVRRGVNAVIGKGRILLFSASFTVDIKLTDGLSGFQLKPLEILGDLGCQ
ncbi:MULTISPECIES: hypothetical protein [Yersinia]|uniref:hypothetical protein n=1 Tax=Yersinia TaxID=629 RepID=UPI0005ABE615|nr:MULTISPECIES: hypothetical protein [Yersinia]MDA5543995.1 hypothetical protein [Yersinia rochesterensis]UZM74645.1 hypothetical protein OP863_17230 [Yersinia sp. SCPM-O-B-9106 (C-191)]